MSSCGPVVVVFTKHGLPLCPDELDERVVGQRVGNVERSVPARAQCGSNFSEHALAVRNLCLRVAVLDASLGIVRHLDRAANAEHAKRGDFLSDEIDKQRLIQHVEDHVPLEVRATEEPYGVDVGKALNAVNVRSEER